MPGGGQPAAVISRAERQLPAAAGCVASRLPRPARPRPSPRSHPGSRSQAITRSPSMS